MYALADLLPWLGGGGGRGERACFFCYGLLVFLLFLFEGVSFLFLLLVLVKGCVILLLHSLSLPYDYILLSMKQNKCSYFI